MKRLFLAFWLLLLPIIGWAQSKYISYSPMGQEDRATANPTECGVLLLSQHADLVITLTNTKDYSITRLGKRQLGYYEYEVLINMASTPNPTLEIGRRGDVNFTKFTMTLRKGVLRAYLIEEVGTPIFMESQNKGNDIVPNEKLAEVEVSSTIAGLKVNVHPDLQASVTTKDKLGDASIKITTIQIPIANIRQPQEHLAQLEREYRERNAALNEKSSDADFERVDQLETAINKQRELMNSLLAIDVSGPETNHLSIDVSELQPRVKMRYGVLQLRTVVREHVSKCAGFLEEGSRLYALRNYDDARRAFAQALTAKDAPNSLKPTIQANIDDCDSCSLYTRYTTASLTKLKRLKEAGNVSQADVAEYYSAAVEYLKVLDKYNPCEYYAKSITALETFIKDMPFTLRFNVVHLTANRVSVGEGGPFAGVEVWAYSGSKTPSPQSYESPRKFRKLMKEEGAKFVLLGVTDAQGIVDTEMRRTALPRGFFLLPVNDNVKVRIFYKDAEDVMSQAQGTFVKRQFRVKLYHK